MTYSRENMDECMISLGIWNTDGKPNLELTTWTNEQYQLGMRSFLWSVSQEKLGEHLTEAINYYQDENNWINSFGRPITIDGEKPINGMPLYWVIYCLVDVITSRAYKGFHEDQRNNELLQRIERARQPSQNTLLDEIDDE